MPQRLSQRDHRRLRRVLGSRGAWAALGLAAVVAVVGGPGRASGRRLALADDLEEILMNPVGVDRPIRRRLGEHPEDEIVGDYDRPELRRFQGEGQAPRHGRPDDPNRPKR